MTAAHLASTLTAVLRSLGVDNVSPSITQSTRAEHGNYASNVAFTLTKDLKKPPLAIATEIANKVQPDEIIDRVEVAKPGFINFFLRESYLLEQVKQISRGTISYIPYYLGEHHRLMIEFAHPNTLKLFHVGHLRNITTGESLVRLFEAAGNEVIRANYQGDVGMHIAKTLWKIKQLDESNELVKIRQSPLRDKIALIGKAYAEGNSAFESNESAKQEIIQINRQIYAKDPDILPLWEETRQWSLEYFSAIYQRVDTTFDAYYFESQMAERGTELCHLAQEQGYLIEDDGALIIPGETYGVDRRVFLNSLGLPTYEGKEVALAEREFSDHGNLDACIHLVTAEQSSFFQAVFKIHELMKLAPPGAQHHQTYGWVDVKGQKMSSRKGNVLEGEWLLNEAKEQILRDYENTSEPTAESLAVAAVKYEFLKHGLQTKVEFDINEAVTLNGNSGPYLLYTYVRTQSVLSKTDDSISPTQGSENGRPDNSLDKTDLGSSSQLTPEEKALINHIPFFTEVVHDATRTIAPHLIANYLFELSQRFNLFYQQNPILQGEPHMRARRVQLTKATAQLLHHGLSLLGITTVSQM
ncbi:MAG: arginine--tRNA ligase [Patescibacteria group bacterium]